MPGLWRRNWIGFEDRTEAGRALADRLSEGADDPALVVVGLPRGGVPVAYEVATALRAPLDVIVVRKLGVPFQPELAMGAIGEEGVRVVNDEIVQLAHVSADELRAVEARERAELEQRAERFRRGRGRLPLAGRTVVIVDDGIATGSTARAACDVARAEGAQRVVLAVPVAPVDWVERLAGAADEFVAVEAPQHFYAVGQFYRDFHQTTDDEVVDLLERAAARLSERGRADDRPLRDEDVQIDVAGTTLEGHFSVPRNPRGLVVFAHGSGSSRHSPRNRYVASVLRQGGLATLLFDLLATDEELDRTNVFDIDLLTERLLAVTAWVRSQPESSGLGVGLFGASTGAAAALAAAAIEPASVGAVVCRGGRPDLAGSHLSAVRTPTLLLVGGRDLPVIDLNRRARDEMTCETQLRVVPGASHLFEEPGALQEVAELARGWFLGHLAGGIGHDARSGT